MVGLDPLLAGRPSVSWRCEGGNGSWQHNPMLCLSQKSKASNPTSVPSSARGRLELWDDSGLLGDLGQACLRGSSARKCLPQDEVKAHQPGVQLGFTHTVTCPISRTPTVFPSPLDASFAPRKTLHSHILGCLNPAHFFPSSSIRLGYR